MNIHTISRRYVGGDGVLGRDRRDPNGVSEWEEMRKGSEEGRN